MVEPSKILRAATFSEDRLFRYWLARRFTDVDAPLRLCVWMNPSDADEKKKDDASIRVGMSFARRWGDGGILVINVMDLVCTDSRELPADENEAIGPLHWDVVDHIMSGGNSPIKKEVLCGWGDRGAGRASVRMVQRMLAHGLVPCTIGLTKSGNPGHPLRKSLDSKLVPFVRVPGARAEYLT